DDGTFATLTNAWPVATTTFSAINTGTTPDEMALQFSVPFACKLDGAWVAVAIGAAGRNFDVVLYDGTNPIATVSVDAEYLSATGSRLVEVSFSEVTLTPDTTYYLDIKPTTANSVTGYSFTVANANHFQAHAGGTSWQYATRTDAGAWSATPTQRLYGG